MSDRAENAALLIARLLMAAALLPTGIARALNVSGFALTLASYGLPQPNMLATVAVLVQVFGPLALIVGVMPRLTGLAMAGFVAGFAAMLHPFWDFAGAQMATERSFLLADFGLAGAFLAYAVAGPGDWSWRGWRAGMWTPVAAPQPVRKAPAKKAAVSRSGGRAPVRAAA